MGEDRDEYVPAPNFIMDNYYSLYPVIQPGVENAPGFPGWKQLHDSLEELYLRNHGPDIWRIKESVKDIMRGKRSARPEVANATSREPRSPVLLRAQFDMHRNSGMLYSPQSVRSLGKAPSRELSFSKVMSSPGPSRASALTSLLHDQSPTDRHIMAVPAPAPAAVIQDLMNEMDHHEQGHGAVLSGCAIESYTPPGEREPFPLIPSSPSSESWGSRWRGMPYGAYIITTLRETNARLIRLGIPADECAVESYSPTETWNPLRWHLREQDQSFREDTSGIFSEEEEEEEEEEEADDSCWERENVQETADTFTPPPLPPANPAVVQPSPEIKPRMDIVPPAPVPKSRKSRQLIKIGKRRIYRVVRYKR
ncbi:hypothetical protein Plec18167_001077 [Paecilomyces lecythidis]|uniref:Uncharacterized protein n=1 Tax=Paecilomyces lecythidis TaxID=3004212 RepID=A0ABR3YCS2_9EURO